MAPPTPRRQESSPLGALLVAWVVVVGLAFAPVGAYYYGTGNILVLISFTAAAFVLGLSLFVAMGLARVGARSRQRSVDDGSIANMSRRGALFGKR